MYAESFDTMNNSNMNYGELMSHMPNISMMDLSSIPNQVSEKQRVKKKKKNGRKETGIYHEGCSAAT